MRRPANILVLAILIGALGAAMVYRYLRAQQTELEAARNVGRGESINVVVANEIVPIGTRIEARHLKMVRWPAETPPDGALHDTASAVGRIARSTLIKNNPVADSQLTGEAAGLLPMLITEGMRAVSVKVDKVTGVSGFITPNSRVDVLVSGNVEGEENQQRSKLFLQNIKVLAIGPSIEIQDDKPVEVPTVTLLVSPDDAEKLTLAARQEPVRLALRNYRDEQSIATGGVSLPQLFGIGARRDGAAAPKVAKPAPPRRPSVEILLGETRTRQEY
jgi:pilus assembly protein CpaB